MTLLGGFQTALSAIYPARCLTCGVTVDSDLGLCGPCWRDTSFIGGTICDSCGVPLPGADSTGDVQCDDCMATPRPWGQGRAALVYGETGRKLVLALKHGDRQEIAHPASRWMQTALRGIVPPEALVVPVPLHRLRLLKRRYNQSALLARALAKRLDRRWCPDLLQRHKRTPSLDGLKAHERTETLKDAISVTTGRRHMLAGRPILLVDDVMTSGATLAACARACLDAGSGPIGVVVLARVAKET